MNELLQRDLVWMTLLLFLPGVCALVLLCFPRGKEDQMRWWALFAAAASLGVSLSVQTLHDTQVLERLGVRQDRSFRDRASLGYRAGVLDLIPSAHAPDATPSAQPARSDDWVARVTWMPRFNVFYYVGVDGISASMLVVTSLVVLLSVLASWTMTQFVRGYLFLILFLQMALFGTFLALDFFVFTVFWGLVLLPVYLLIGLWGGPDRYAVSLRFFLTGFVGCVLVLFALVGLYFTNVRDFVHPDVVESAAVKLADSDPSADERPTKIARARQVVVVNTFDLLVWQRAGRAALQHLRQQPLTQVPALSVREEQLAEARREHPEFVPALEADLAETRKAVVERMQQQPFFQEWFQYTLFGVLFVAFALQLPIVPLHFWWPGVQADAPTPVSMLLSGVFPLLGGYGLFRVVYPLCPWAAEQLALVVAILGVVTLLYAGLVALGQDDLKKLVAYWSISQMGFVLLGLSAVTTSERAAYWAWGANGALFVLLAHAITAAGLYYVVGMVAERAKHRRLELLGGLAEPMPATTGLAAVLFFAALGLPGLCGFVGPILVLLGAWNSSWILTGLALLTILVVSGTLVGAYQRIFFGTNPRYKNVTDATPLEMTVCVVLIFLAVLFGFWPGFLLDSSEPAVTGLIDTLVRLPAASPPG